MTPSIRDVVTRLGLVALLTLSIITATGCRRALRAAAPASAGSPAAPATRRDDSPELPAIPLPPPPPSIPQGDDRRVHREWSDLWRRVRVDVRGVIELTDDERDVKSVSPDGYFELSSRGWQSVGGPRYLVRRGTDGAVTRLFTVSGRERPIDAAARVWIGDEIQRLVRAGFDAEGRVARILTRQGTAGVLDEISRLSGDFVRAQYFRQLLKQARLEGPSAERTLQQASREIRSDYERARVLIAFAGAVTLDETLAPSFVDATTSMQSDFEHARVLTTLLAGPRQTPVVVHVALMSSPGIRSDFEKSRVLTELVQIDGVDPSTRDSFFGVVRTMRSDFERGRVLLALARKDGLQGDTVVDIVRSTSAMGSDFEKSRVLLQVIAVQPMEGTTKQALLEAASTIGSDHERGRVLSALFRTGRLR